MGILGRAELREQISHFLLSLETALTAVDAAGEIAEACAWRPDPASYEGRPAFLGERKRHIAFKCTAGAIKDDVLVPKYYDPTVTERLSEFSDHCELSSIEDLL